MTIQGICFEVSPRMCSCLYLTLRRAMLYIQLYQLCQKYPPPPPHLCCCCYLLLCSMLITGKVKAKGQGREDFRYETTRAKYRVSQTGTFYKE